MKGSQSFLYPLENNMFPQDQSSLRVKSLSDISRLGLQSSMASQANRPLINTMNEIPSRNEQIITKLEPTAEQLSPTTPTFPFKRPTSNGPSDVRTHLSNLESQLLKFDSESSRFQNNSMNCLNPPSLTDIPNIQMNHFNHDFGRANSMVFGNTGGSIFPQVGLNQLTNPNPFVNHGQFMQNQVMRNVDPLQLNVNNVLTANLLSNEITRQQELQNQMNQIKLLNSLQAMQSQPHLQTPSLSSLNPVTLNLGINPIMRTFEPSVGNAIPLITGGSNVSLNDPRSKLGVFGSHPSYHEANMTKSTAMSDSSSPRHTKIVSFNSHAGTLPSLLELAEPNSGGQNPSITSLDEEIKDDLSPHANPTLSAHSQFDAWNVDNEDALSKNSYTSITKGLNSFSLPDVRSDFRIKLEELGNHILHRYGPDQVPGVYPKEVRAIKILKYKKKIVKWRINHPVNRTFNGRSAVAGTKPRIKGKFVSSEKYQHYLETKKKSEPLKGDKSAQKPADVKIEECA